MVAIGWAGGGLSEACLRAFWPCAGYASVGERPAKGSQRDTAPIRAEWRLGPGPAL